MHLGVPNEIFLPSLVKFTLSKRREIRFIDVQIIAKICSIRNRNGIYILLLCRKNNEKLEIEHRFFLVELDNSRGLALMMILMGLLHGTLFRTIEPALMYLREI